MWGRLTFISELDDLLVGFKHASDVSGIWEGFSNFLTLRDIKAYTYHSLPAIGAADYRKSYSYYENLHIPLEPRSRLAKPCFQRLLSENARSLIRPEFWSDWEALNVELQSVESNAEDPQLHASFEGISIPVHGPRWSNGCFSLELSGLKPNCRDIDIQTLQWVCQYAHQNLCRLLTHQKPDLPKLTARETQILTWIALGKSNADIADILGISFHTVGTYTRRIFVKTNTNNRTSAALFGISNGLINL